MHKIDVPSATAGGEFTEGSPAGGVPATTVTAAWLNDVQGELIAILAAAGVAPLKGIMQILQALPAALASRPEFGRTLGQNGHQILPGGFILQWGGAQNSALNQVYTLPIAFPTQVFGSLVAQVSASGGSFMRYYSLASLTQISITKESGLTTSHFWIALGK